MSSPVLPSDFKGVISDPTSTLCGNFISTLLKMPVLLYKLVNWMLDASGNPSNDFISLVVNTGDIIMSASPSEDSSRLLCNGQEKLRTDFPALFAVVGLSFGTPSNDSVFKLPDLRAAFPCGVGAFPSGLAATLGVPGGEEKHVLTPAEGADKNHVHSTGRFNTQDGVVMWAASGSITDTGSGWLEKGDGTPAESKQVDTQTGPWVATGGVIGASDPVGHSNLPPFLPVYFLIKT